ncbi:peptidyl-tRNA hydrolase [Streptomyces albiaxialis]|uniref:peptidyl-tRNA hydrolase n=1 Tax=Streptomyces albiaxialis TaxID=329523 RepID=A0ABN2W3Q2_9ACTN
MSDSPNDPHAPHDRQDPHDPHDPPYVLPLVVRIERAAPPARTDALETAARAVLTFLSDPRTADGAGPWHEPVRAWEERGIRKVVRRARGSEWRRAEPLPGLTVTGRTAEVRVFPPVPVDAWPKDLARLQVSGTDLTDPEPPPAPAADVPVLWLSPELEMTAGKAMAQAAHGAQLAWWDLDAAAREAWRAADFPLAVRTARDAAHWRELTAGALPVVRDAGFTEIPADSCTVVADHPALRLGPEPQIDL